MQNYIVRVATKFSTSFFLGSVIFIVTQTLNVAVNDGLDLSGIEYD